MELAESRRVRSPRTDKEPFVTARPLVNDTLLPRRGNEGVEGGRGIFLPRAHARARRSIRGGTAHDNRGYHVPRCRRSARSASSATFSTVRLPPSFPSLSLSSSSFADTLSVHLCSQLVSQFCVRCWSPSDADEASSVNEHNTSLFSGLRSRGNLQLVQPTPFLNRRCDGERAQRRAHRGQDMFAAWSRRCSKSSCAFSGCVRPFLRVRVRVRFAQFSVCACVRICVRVSLRLLPSSSPVPRPMS